MFYEFRQNNSGGMRDFDLRLGISRIVVIEADSANDANERAEAIGLYFDGASEYDRDCPCCGSRWYRRDESDGSEVPSYYGTSIAEQTPVHGEPFSNLSPELFVHYADGAIEGYILTAGSWSLVDRRPA